MFDCAPWNSSTPFPALPAAPGRVKPSSVPIQLPATRLPLPGNAHAAVAALVNDVALARQRAADAVVVRPGQQY